MNPDTDPKIVEVYRTVYEPADSEDGTLKDHSELDCTPDEDDIEEGRTTPVDMAVYYIRDRLYISGQHSASGYAPNPRYRPNSGEPRCIWPGPGTWFADEPYHHPYRDEREETTAHLNDGWTDQQKHEIWARVTDNVPAPEAANGPTPGAQDWEIIHIYTRAQAIEDGVLRDVTAQARTTGFRLPVALTAAAWGDCVAWDEADNDRKGTVQDEAGRLADVLTMTHVAIRRNPGDTDRVRVHLVRTPRPGRVRAAQPAELTAVIGPGDRGEPVITIMMVGED